MWAQKHPMSPAASASPSFNKGAAIAVNQSKPGKLRKPRPIKPKKLTPTVNNV